jgi:hypothetical protein
LSAFDPKLTFGSYVQCRSLIGRRYNEQETAMLRPMLLASAAVGLLLLGACDGPREQGGEEADVASGAVDNEDTLRSGPAETLGERADEAQESAEEATEAHADALEEQAEATRDAAKSTAERLEQQADEVRGN